MAYEVGTAYLQILPSMDGLQNAIEREIRGVDTDRAGRAAGDGYTSGFGGAAKKLTGILGAAFAAVKIGDFAKDAVAQASDLQESATKLEAVFGDGTAAINEFAAQGAKALGQSNLAVKDAAATFGVFGKAAGLAGQENAKFSSDLVSLSTDLASFYNSDPSAVVEALGAGLRGEAEPLRQFGILMDDATLRNKALELGLVKTTKDALEPQQKVLAAQAVIMEQTSIAQGDFAKTSGGLANQQRILAAQFEDMKGKIGAAFLPAVTATVTALNERLFPVLESLGGKAAAAWNVLKTGDFEGAAAGIGEEDSPLVRSLLFAHDLFGRIGPGLREAWGVLSTGDFQGGNGIEEDSPLVNFLFNLRDVAEKVGASIGPVFQKLMDTIGPVFKEIGNVLGPAVVDTFDKLWGAIEPLIPTIVELVTAFNPFKLILDALGPVLPKIVNLLADLVESVGGVLAKAIETAAPLVEKLVAAFMEFVPVLVDALAPILPVIADVLGDLAEVIGDALISAMESLTPLFESIVGVVQRLLPFIASLVEKLLPPLASLFEKIAPLLDAVLGALMPIVDAIVAALIPAIEALMPIVERVFQFFADSIENVITVVSGVIEFITGVFTGDWSRAWEGIKQIFEGIWNQLKNVVSLVWDGIMAVLSAAWSWIDENALRPLGAGVEAVENFFTDLWGVVENVWNWITDKLSTAWNFIRDVVFAPLKAGIDAVGQFFSDLWGTVQNVWNWIQDKISTVWNWLNQYVFAPMNLAINTVGTFFNNLWTTVQTVWNNISGFFVSIAQGIEDAVTTVKDAIKKIVDAIAEFIGGLGTAGRPDDSLTGAGEAGIVPGGSARGGVIPGTDPGRRDNVLGRLPNGVGWGLRSEEAVMVPEFTHSVGGAAGVYKLNRAAEQGTLGEFLGGFARGGVVGNKVHDTITDQVGTKLEDIVDEFLSTRMSSGPVPAGARGAFIQAMLSKIGTEYVWGAAGPNVFDCSGLVSWALEQAGVGKGRLTAEGFNSSFPHVSTPRPGDLVTFDTGRLPGRAGHIGAVTDPAKGLMMHTDGAGPARVSDYLNRGGLIGFVDVIGGDYVPAASSDSKKGDPATGWLDRIIGKIESGGGVGGGVVTGSGTWGTTAKLNTNTPDQWPNRGTMEQVGPVPPGGALDRWRPMYADALMAKGQFSDSNLNAMMNQMRTESSGNPLAINLTDINAQRGYPSKSLLQVIGPTFRDNGEPGFNTNIWDPWSNALASVNYGLKRYGSLSNAYRGVAYDWGGWLPPGLTPTVNMLNKPEAVLTPAQSNAYVQHAQAIADGFGGQLVEVTIRGEGVLTDALAEASEVTLISAARQFATAGGQSQ